MPDPQKGSARSIDSDAPGELVQPISVDVPSAARVYDYLLGGGHNFAVDRVAAEKLLELFPARNLARLNRGYLQRAVRFLLDQGIRQFLDLGSGIPTVGNVHEITEGTSSKVLYVDEDPVAVTHAELILASNPEAAVVLAEFVYPESIVVAARDFLDLEKPVGLLAVNVLHYISSDEVLAQIVSAYRELLAPGSYFAFSHLNVHSRWQPLSQGKRSLNLAGMEISPRTTARIASMLGGFELVPPGIVKISSWYPSGENDDEEDADLLNAGVARKAVGNEGKWEGLINLAGPDDPPLYPDFQFAPNGFARNEVVVVNDLLGSRNDPVGVYGWWRAINSWLGAKPIDLIGTGRDREILEAARAVGRE